MKGNARKKVLLISCLTVFLISITSINSILNSSTPTDINNTDGEDITSVQVKGKISGFWKTNTTRIHVKGNWSETNTTYSWCNGSGTLGDPYIIENVTIDATQANSCIIIEDTNDYFIIRNCTFLNSSRGGINASLILNNVSNGTIIENFFHSSYYGIWINSSSKLTLTKNWVFHSKMDGIYLKDSTLNKFEENQLYNNTLQGINLVNSDSNTMTSNIIHHNKQYGVYLDANSGANLVNENYLGYNTVGCIQNLGLLNNLTNNDCVGSYVVIPVYGTLPEPDQTETIMTIIIVVIVVSVISGTLIVLQVLKKKDIIGGKSKKRAVKDEPVKGNTEKKE